MKIRTLLRNTCNLQKVRILNHNNMVIYDGLLCDLTNSIDKYENIIHAHLIDRQFDFFIAENDVVTIYL